MELQEKIYGFHAQKYLLYALKWISEKSRISLIALKLIPEKMWLNSFQSSNAEIYGLLSALHRGQLAGSFKFEQRVN